MTKPSETLTEFKAHLSTAALNFRSAESLLAQIQGMLTNAIAIKREVESSSNAGRSLTLTIELTGHGMDDGYDAYQAIAKSGIPHNKGEADSGEFLFDGEVIGTWEVTS